MIVTIHQPNYLPWPGFFHKWMQADALVILDTVQYHKNEWQNRNRIKNQGGAQWLTVPVTYRFPQRICDVGVAASPWAKKQIRSIEQAYAKAPYLQQYWPGIKDVLEQSWSGIGDLNTALIRILGEMLACKAPLYLASELKTQSDEPTERLISICQELKADGYLSGQEGRTYLQNERFSEAGISLYFQQVDAPIYAQLHGDFISHLSVLDMLFNVGDQTATFIQQMGGDMGAEEQ